RVNFGGWPFGLPFWPLTEAFGPVVAWNVLILLTYLAAGWFTLLWLLELGLPRVAALFGGLVFTLAPYRVAQSTGHLRGPISILIPLALWAFERARRGSRWWIVLSGAAIASIPFSDLHLALGAVPFFFVYALCRTRSPWLLAGAAACVAAAAGASLPRSRSARLSRSSSRSGRTSRFTPRSGTTSNRCATRACRSASSQSPVSPSPLWPRSPSPGSPGQFRTS